MNSQGNPTYGVYSSTEELLRLRYLAKDLSLAPKRNSRALLNGAQHTRFRGRGMEFAEVRGYQAGDDIRTIDWRVTARTGSPHTKLFQEERERPVLLVVDQRSPMFFGSRSQFKSVFAVELAGIIAWTAQANNDRIGAFLFGDRLKHEVRARRGKHAVLELLHHMLQLNHALAGPAPPADGQRLVDMLMDVRRVSKPGSSVFVLSDCHDFTEQCREPLTTLARHCDVTLVHLYDRLEQQLPSSELLPVTDGREHRILNTRSRALREAFSRRFAELQHKLRTACDAAAIPLISTSMDQSAEDLARDMFTSRRGGARRAIAPARRSP